MYYYIYSFVISSEMMGNLLFYCDSLYSSTSLYRYTVEHFADRYEGVIVKCQDIVNPKVS